MKLYHGSEFEFDTFNYDKLGHNALFAGCGHYFSNLKVLASMYSNDSCSDLLSMDWFFDGKKYNLNKVLNNRCDLVFRNCGLNFNFQINFDVPNFNYKDFFIKWLELSLKDNELYKNKNYYIQKIDDYMDRNIKGYNEDYDKNSIEYLDCLNKYDKLTDKWIKKQRRTLTKIQKLYVKVLKSKFIEVKLPKFLYEVEVETKNVHYIFKKSLMNQILQQLKRENKFDSNFEPFLKTLIGKPVYDMQRQSKLKDFMFEKLYGKYDESLLEKIEFKNKIERRLSNFFDRCGIDGFAFRVDDFTNIHNQKKLTNYEYLIFNTNCIKSVNKWN